MNARSTPSTHRQGDIEHFKREKPYLIISGKQCPLQYAHFREALLLWFVTAPQGPQAQPLWVQLLRVCEGLRRQCCRKGSSRISNMVSCCYPAQRSAPGALLVLALAFAQATIRAGSIHSSASRTTYAHKNGWMWVDGKTAVLPTRAGCVRRRE